MRNHRVKGATKDEPKARRTILARLKSVEGHVRGVIEMVAADRYCIDVVRQTRAIQAALDRVNRMVLEGHLGHCVSRGLRSQDAAERERVIAELLDVFEAS
jgi:CsoR family transcriptional regulator, copper-sensing transcriptional repressor